MLGDKTIKAGLPWLGPLDAVHTAVQIGNPATAYSVLSGTPEDMDRLAEAAHAAAERARAAEPELRAQAGEGASS
jgi:malonyl CoA-acyl carrier protein transacylase